MQTYQQFKDFVALSLWKQNDAELVNNLDNLIRIANNELSRELRDMLRSEVTIVINPTTEDFDLSVASGLKTVVGLVRNGTAGLFKPVEIPEMRQTTITDLYSRRANRIFGYAHSGHDNVYAIEQNGNNKTLLLNGDFSVENPGDFTLIYRRDVPDYATEDASWVEDEHQDLYLYTIYYHCAVFLREDERIQMYSGLKQAALTSVDEDDKHNQALGGEPLQMRPHRVVP